MAPLITVAWRRRRGAGSAGLKLIGLIGLKRFLLLPVVALALAPMVMGSLPYSAVAARGPSLRQTVVAANGSATLASSSCTLSCASDGDGGPPVL